MTSQVKRIALTMQDCDQISQMAYDKKRKVIGYRSDLTFNERQARIYPRLCEICGDSLKDKTKYFNHVVRKHGIVGVVL